MKKIILLTILLSHSSLSLAHKEKVNDKKTLKSLKLYNANGYNGIFDLFSFDMQNALPKEQANDFLLD